MENLLAYVKKSRVTLELGAKTLLPWPGVSPLLALPLHMLSSLSGLIQ